MADIEEDGTTSIVAMGTVIEGHQVEHLTTILGTYQASQQICHSKKRGFSARLRRSYTTICSPHIRFSKHRRTVFVSNCMRKVCRIKHMLNHMDKDRLMAPRVNNMLRTEIEQARLISRR